MKSKKIVFTLIAVFTVITSALAQAPGFDDTVDDVAPIPGILIAAAVGLAIGARKLYKNK